MIMIVRLTAPDHLVWIPWKSNDLCLNLFSKESPTIEILIDASLWSREASERSFDTSLLKRVRLRRVQDFYQEVLALRLKNQERAVLESDDGALRISLSIDHEKCLIRLSIHLDMADVPVGESVTALQIERSIALDDSYHDLERNLGDFVRHFIALD